MALLRIDEEQVLVVTPRGADEVVHLAVGDDERRILLGLIHLEVVVVVGQERELGRRLDVGFGLLGGRVDEEQVGDERLEHPFALAVDILLYIPLGDIAVGAIVDEIVEGTVLTTIGGTEDEPRLLRIRDVGHHCPTRSVLGFRERAH